MNSSFFKVPFSRVKSIIQQAYGSGARSRREVEIIGIETYSMHDYWDGGSRARCVFIDLVSGKVLPSSAIPREQRQQKGNPFNLPIADITLTPRYAIVVHSTFCGKDMGYRIYIHPTTFQVLNYGYTGQGVGTNHQLTLPSPGIVVDQLNPIISDSNHNQLSSSNS